MTAELVAMIHLAGWPHDAGGAPSIDAVVDGALADARTLTAAGFGSIMLQNLRSRSPWRADSPQEVACLSMLLTQLRSAHPDVRFGLNLPSDDPEATIAVAYATGARFVRLKVWIGVMRRLEGTLEGCAYAALQYRRMLGADHIDIWSDVLDRTGTAVWPTDFARALEEAQFAGAETVVVTGDNQGQLLDRLKVARAVAPELRLIIGGGATAANVAELLLFADGVIVGGALQEQTRERRISAEAASAFLTAAAGSV